MSFSRRTQDLSVWGQKNAKACVASSCNISPLDSMIRDFQGFLRLLFPYLIGTRFVNYPHHIQNAAAEALVGILSPIGKRKVIAPPCPPPPPPRESGPLVALQVS